MKYKISGVVDLQLFNNKIIYRSRNGGTSVGVGAADIIKNINSGLWSFNDVKGYKLFLFQFLQRAMMEDEPSTLQAADDIMKMFPDSLNISAVRWDLFWAGRNTERVHPDRSWGSKDFPFPNKSYGATPRGNLTWKQVNLPVKQNNINKKLTGGILTNPYRIEIGSDEWLVRENQMDLSNENWLYHIARCYIKWLNMLPYVQGILVGPVKYQWAANLNPAREKLSEWITSGRDLTQWGARALFDYSSYTVLDVIESSWKFVKIIKQLDPSVIVVYDPFSSHVPWGSLTLNQFEYQWRQKYGTDPKIGMERNQLDILNYSDYYMFPTEEINNSEKLGAEYLPEKTRNYIRQSNNWCEYPTKFQNRL